MELMDFMTENHTKVYSGYNHQPTIAMMSALLIGWNCAEKKHRMVEHLKERPHQLIKYTFNFIQTLDPPVIRDTETNYNSYALLEKFAQTQSRQVVVLESPMNESICALEFFADIPFQVHYATPAFGKNRPIVLWETHLMDD